MSTKEKIHFIEIAYGSLMESYCQLQLAEDLGYISQKELNAIHLDVNSIAKMLTVLRRSYLKLLNP